jgi:hypothetical protein
MLINSLCSPKQISLILIATTYTNNAGSAHKLTLHRECLWPNDPSVRLKNDRLHIVKLLVGGDGRN